MEMRANSRAYDIFKLIVAVLLLILFIVLNLRGGSAKPVAELLSGVTPSVVPTALPAFPPAAYWKFDADREMLLNQEEKAIYQLDKVLSDWVPIVPAAISSKLSAGYQVEKDGAGQWVIFAKDGSVAYRWDSMKMQWTAEQGMVATGIPSPVSSPMPSSTPAVESVTTNGSGGRVVESPTPSVLPENSNASGDCPQALPSRIKVGDTVKLSAYLNMRTDAKMEDNLILLNPFGTQLKIVGGPECVPYQSKAYVFWQVERLDGQTGWSAEGSLTGNLYFMEPVP